MFSVMPGADATAPAGAAYWGGAVCGGMVDPAVAPAAAASPTAVPHFGQKRPSTDVPQLGQKAIRLILLLYSPTVAQAALYSKAYSLLPDITVTVQSFLGFFRSN